MVMDADATTPDEPPIMFLHWVFGTPSLLDPWIRRFWVGGGDLHIAHAAYSACKYRLVTTR